MQDIVRKALEDAISNESSALSFPNLTLSSVANLSFSDIPSVKNLLPNLTLALNASELNHTVQLENIEKALEVVLSLGNATSNTTSSLTNFTAEETAQAVDTLIQSGYVFSASPYEPGGWAEIFAVVVCSVAIFLFPFCGAFVAVLRWGKHPSSPALTPRYITPRFVPRRVIRVFSKFFQPLARVERDVERVGLEGASLLLLQRELGRFILALAVLVNVVLVPIHKSFPPSSLASDFVPYTFQNVPFHKNNAVLWIHIVLVVAITFFTLRFSRYLMDEIRRIERRASSPRRNSSRSYFVSGKTNGEPLSEAQLAQRCTEDWFPLSGVQSVKLFHQAKLGDDEYFFRLLMTCERRPAPPLPPLVELEPAPNAKDILWPAFSYPKYTSLLRSMGVNLVLIVVLCVCTTPIAFVTFVSSVSSATIRSEVGSTYMNFVTYVRGLNEWFGDFLFAFLPQLLLVICDAWLLAVLSFSSKRFELFFTTSEREKSVLKKGFWFLVFNTLILPSLALSSIGSFVGRLFQNETSPFSLLGKAFATSSGAFTLTFIATQTWVGASMDIARVSERALNFLLTKCSRGSSRGVEFDYGNEYALCAAMFALCVCFATVVPPILTFGVMYFFVKSATDDYLLRHVVVETKSQGDLSVGRSAVRYLVVGLLLLQSALFGFLSAQTCRPVLGAAAAERGAPCVDTDVSGVLVERGSFAQLLALLTCFIGTCVAALRQYLRGGEEEEEGVEERNYYLSPPHTKEEAKSLREGDSSVPQDAFDV